jgi:stage IV sporulation protein FB
MESRGQSFPWADRVAAMRDPFAWSLPVGRLFGINIRIHVLFLALAAGFILRACVDEKIAAVPGRWIDAAVLMGLLALSVLLHEFGHCFAARWLNGDAPEVLLWPLGGLATVEVPQTPRAVFLSTVAGPVVNLLLFVVCGAALLLQPEPIRVSLFQYPWRESANGAISLIRGWAGEPVSVDNPGLIFLARLAWVNWLLFGLNLLPAFPLDGGRLFQSGLWRYVGFRQSTVSALFTSFVVLLVAILVSIALNELLPLILAGVIYLALKHQWILLETGGEESLFGYDFSQGYTSLERDQPPAPAVRRPNPFQRWLQRRAARKMQREMEVREAEELRMDALLEKVQTQGLSALTDEERRFLKRVSDRYRNRH